MAKDIGRTEEFAAEEEKESVLDTEASGEAKEEETAAEEISALDDGEEDEDSLEQNKAKSFFKKKVKKDKKDEKIEELNDRLMRLMAEFENYRKRTEKEKSQMFEVGAKGILEKILPVIDNFERGLSMVTEEEKELAFVQGFDKIYRQMMDSLAACGLEAIEAVGNAFDPNLHNAVMHGEDDSLSENIVAEEFQKGYMYRDSVVRHSMVRVVN